MGSLNLSKSDVTEHRFGMSPCVLKNGPVWFVGKLVTRVDQGAKPPCLQSLVVCTPKEVEPFNLLGKSIH